MEDGQKQIRLILAEDHRLIRAGLCALLEAIPWIEVVADAKDGQEAFEMVERFRPDIVLMDIAMPGVNGLAATERILADFPTTRVIILSMHNDEEYIIHALNAGASGYLLKDCSPEELEAAVRTALSGGSYLSPASQTVLTQYMRRVGLDARNETRLTARQEEVLQLIALGLTNKEIAQKLQISVKSVETHRTQLMNKLDIHNVAGLVRYAIRNKIIPINE